MLYTLRLVLHYLLNPGHEGVDVHEDMWTLRVVTFIQFSKSSDALNLCVADQRASGITRTDSPLLARRVGAYHLAGVEGIGPLILALLGKLRFHSGLP